MPLTPVPHCVKTEIRHIIDAQNVYVTYFTQLTAEPDATELEAMANAAETSWGTHWQPLLTTAAQLVEIVCTSLTGLTGARVSHLVDPPLAGSVPGNYLPLNSTLAIKKNTGNRGKGRNGRIYWPQLTETNVTGDLADPVYVALLVTAAHDMGTDIALGAPAGADDVVAHQHGAHAGTSDPIISYVASDNYIDSQRDRLPRHKRKKKHA